MLNFRTFALAAALAGTMALPAFAQTADTQPTTTTEQAPAAVPDQTPVPDTGMKKAPTTAKSTHKHKHVRAKTATQVRSTETAPPATPQKK
jgi:hypothetical protein